MERHRPVLLNKKGVTLVEMLVALTILLIVSLALMKTALLGITANVQNALRDEAVSIAEMKINQLTSRPFTETLIHSDLTATTNAPEAAVRRNFRGFFVDFTPRLTIADLNANSKQMTISVAWAYRGTSYTHSVTTIMRKQ